MFAEPLADGRVRVKVCGLTSLADSLLALECGADALGFNFFQGSKRFLDAQIGSRWLEELPREACKVALLVNPSWEEATRAASWPFIDALQLHGEESPDFCRRLAEAGIRFAKALPVYRGQLPLAPNDYSTSTVLLDSKSERGFGGTGEAFPWRLAREFIEEHPGLRVTLAGGLNPENVAAAIVESQPFGVDVTTGVEAAPGRKDPARLRAFFAAIRASP